ncbi:MAG: DNA-directed RNA polymerase subunit omega [Alphaproteobacteria bacterium]|nr:MAG: DNA-directed RNA polymerase subunit omega [Alphaproteobacteria bacterium]
MARVTNRDCIQKIPNRFDLIILTSQRARQIIGGASLTIDRNDDKPTVLALREVAAGTVTADQLRESLLYSLRKHHGHLEETEEELESLLASDGDFFQEEAGSSDLEDEDFSDNIGFENDDIAENDSSIIIGDGE